MANIDHSSFASRKEDYINSELENEIIERTESVPPGNIQIKRPPKQPSSLSSGKKFFIGLVIVVLIACSWVGSTQTAKSAFTGGFKAPFFSMWFGTAWMITLFPLSAPIYFLARKGKNAKDLWR